MDGPFKHDAMEEASHNEVICYIISFTQNVQRLQIYKERLMVVRN